MLKLLKGVSRSFYLSIRLLPAPLREPVALGYLLARASDTIADVAGLDQHDRLETLARFIRAVDGAAPWLPMHLVGDASPEESALLDALPQCFEWLRRLAPDDREDVRTVLGQITHGQRLDVERFGEADAGHPWALANADELDEYTYLVAGCVGEFWTNLGFRHVPGFASLPQDEMLDLGRSYGMALQMINVLRDADLDLAIGRRYLPDGVTREMCMESAHAGLEDGMRYACALRHARVRVASALPALIGARTLALLRTQGAGAKMPRSEVRALLLRILFAFGSNAAIQREFRRWDNSPR